MKYDHLSHHEILSSGLMVLDGTAAAMCSDNDIPLIVFDLHDPDNIYDAVIGKKVGTLVNNQN